MATQILLLWELQQHDSKVDEIDKRISEVPGKRSSIDGKLALMDAEKKQKEDEIVAISKEKTEREAEIASQDEKIKLVEARLGNIRSPKDYEDMRKNLEKARRANKAREDNVLELMSKMEALQASLDEYMQGFDSDRAGIAEGLKVFEEEERRLASERETLVSERSEYSTKVDQALLDRYEMLRSKMRGVAVSMARNMSCEGCFMSLRPQVFNLVIRDEEIQYCPSCHRFLVFIPEKTDESGEK